MALRKVEGNSGPWGRRAVGPASPPSPHPRPHDPTARSSPRPCAAARTRAALLALLLLAPAAASADQCDFSAPPDQLAACQAAFRAKREARHQAEAEKAARATADDPERAALRPWILAAGAVGVLGGLAYGFRRRRPVLGGPK